MTIGLCIITKDWTPELAGLLMGYQHYFDTIYVQVNGKNNKMKSFANVEISSFKWNDNFSDARNALLAEVKTDYWVWIDTDDTINNPRAIRPLVEDMDSKGVDRMFALYEYAKNDIGEEVGDHWRERIMKTAHPYVWAGAVHETLLTPARETTAKTELFKVIHHKSAKEYDDSIKRNHKILEVEYSKEPRDPRITMYLGMSYFTMQKWERANELLIEHIRTSGSLEDKYRSWLKVAECHAKMSELTKSISACMEAVKLLPNYPDAYFGLAQFYYELEDYERCLEWIKIGLTKPDPTTLSIVDPTLRYRTIMMGALAEFQLGRVSNAWELINNVLELSPKYALANKFYPMFKEAYLEQEAIEHAKWLITYTHNSKGKPLSILQGLPDNLISDIRLNGVRSKLYPPKIWPSKSIVFFCGASLESWGADTLEAGMGGSEEAIVYLSRQMAKLGWSVTVFNDREEKYEADGVTWLPWHTYNPKDQFDVFVTWRAPESAELIKARLLVCDLHDTVEPERIEAATYIDKFMVKSKYHRDLYPNVPDEKFAIVSNGINRSDFK